MAYKSFRGSSRVTMIPDLGLDIDGVLRKKKSWSPVVMIVRK
jgi:hypothetical protein